MSEAIKRSGELLLKGWTMLGNSCPICNCALFATKDRSECVCPSCNLPVKFESEMKKLGQTFTEKKAIVDDFELFNEEDYDDGIQLPSSLEEMKKEWDAKTKIRDVVSGLIGEAMMGGWTMLSTSCTKTAVNHPTYDGVLLVSKGGITKCVACEKGLGKPVASVAPRVSLASPPPAPTPAVAKPVKLSSPPPAPVTTANVNYKGSDDSEHTDDELRMVDRSSTLIGQYLLKGYTMLDETCSAVPGSACFHKVPLVKRHNQVAVCVVCNSAAAASSTTGVGVASKKKVSLSISTATQPHSRDHSNKHVAFADGLNPGELDEDGGESDRDSDYDEAAAADTRKIQNLASLRKLEGTKAAIADVSRIHAHAAEIHFPGKYAGSHAEARLQTATDSIMEKICILSAEMAVCNSNAGVKEFSDTIANLLNLVKSMNELKKST